LVEIHKERAMNEIHEDGAPFFFAQAGTIVRRRGF